MNKEYVLDSASEMGRQQLDYLTVLFDEPATACLDAVGVKPGWRCLDLGSGNGSVARWLAARVGPAGKVVAADIDTDHLVGGPGIEVVRHDINDGVPGGSFDLIHARFVLMHVPRREEILVELVDALAPGGWLVLGETDDRPQRVLRVPSEADRAVLDHVVHTGIHVVACGAGVSVEWAYQVYDRMTAVGLENVDSVEYGRTISGGATGGWLYISYIKQIESRILDAGVTEEELHRFYELMLDPEFRAWPFIRLIMTRGQKPQAPLADLMR